MYNNDTSVFKTILKSNHTLRSRTKVFLNYLMMKPNIPNQWIKIIYLNSHFLKFLGRNRWYCFQNLYSNV